MNLVSSTNRTLILKRIVHKSTWDFKRGQLEDFMFMIISSYQDSFFQYTCFKSQGNVKKKKKKKNSFPHKQRIVVSLPFTTSIKYWSQYGLWLNTSVTKQNLSSSWWHIPVIPVLLEAEAGGLKAPVQPGQFSKNLPHVKSKKGWWCSSAQRLWVQCPVLIDRC